MFEQKRHRVVRQTLRLGRDRALHCQVTQEPLDVGDAQSIERLAPAEEQEAMTPIDVGLLGADRVLHGTDGSRQVFQDRKRLCRAAESRDTDCPRIGTVLGAYGRTARDRRVLGGQGPLPLPPIVPIDPFPGRNLRQVNQQQAQGIDNLPHLPVRQIGAGRHASQVVRDLVRRQRRQGRRLEVLQEILDPSDVPLTELRGDLTADQEIQVTIPVRRRTVLTAWPGGVDLWHP